MMKKKVLVALSGGVDSAVTALLLKNAGYHVEGVWLKLLGKAAESADRVQSVANSLDIKLHIIDKSEDFEQRIIQYFVREYQSGRTPNPCAQCNRSIKFSSFIQYADELGFEFVATGHYALIDIVNDVPRLCRGVDSQRDQSYYLFNIEQTHLSRILFPLGGFSKPYIRSLASEAEIPVASTPDSQDICFLTCDMDYKAFLRSRECAIKTGHFLDANGKILGEHLGLPYYTVGQRKGLGIDRGGPWFVTQLDSCTNTVTVGKEDELLSDGLFCDSPNWLMPDLPDTFEAEVMIRYRHKPVKSTITKLPENRICVNFSTPQNAVAPGQAAVFYDGDCVLGGGWISEPIRSPQTHV